MIGTTVTLVAAFLAHPTHGINALVQNIPRYHFAAPGETPVEKDAPPTVAIYNDAEHKDPDGKTISLENGYRVPEYPSIVVLRETRELDSGAGKIGDARNPEPKQIGIVIAYVTDDKADQLTAQDNCELLLRAAERSLRRFKSHSKSAEYRALNGIEIMDVTAWKRIEETNALDVTKFWGWLEVELKVVDSIA